MKNEQYGSFLALVQGILADISQDKMVINDLNDKFELYANGGDVDSDVRRLLLSNFAGNCWDETKRERSEDESLTFLLELYKKSNFSAEKSDILSALGRFANMKNKKRNEITSTIIEWTLKNVKTSDFFYSISEFGL